MSFDEQADESLSLGRDKADTPRNENMRGSHYTKEVRRSGALFLRSLSWLLLKFYFFGTNLFAIFRAFASLR